MKQTLGWLAIGLLAAGVVLGFLPVHSAGYNCGSAFHESSGLRTDEFSDTLGGGSGANDCDAERADARAMPIALVILGLAMAGATLSAPSERRNAPDAHESDQPTA